MILIWMETTHNYDAFGEDATDQNRVITVEKLTKVSEQEFPHAMQWYQKKWARRDTLNGEVTIHTFNVPEWAEDADILYKASGKGLVHITEEGEETIITSPSDSMYSIEVQKLHPKVFEYTHCYCVFSDRIFGGVDIEFEIVFEEDTLGRHVWGNSFEEALTNAHKRTRKKGK